MLKIENQIIQRVGSESIQLSCPICISNCIIDILDFVGLEFEKKVVIEGCVIKDLKIYSSWFIGGLLFSNNIVLCDIDYEMGGHNKEKVIIEKNIFNGFFSFFDCHFEEEIILVENVFAKNSDLLALENKGFDNIFEKGYNMKDNIGRFDVLHVSEKF